MTTKPKLAREMLAEAFRVGVPARWVTADAVYGNDRSLQLGLQERQQAYVLAVTGQESVWMGYQQRHVKDLLATAPEGVWQILSAGQGAAVKKGQSKRAIPPSLQEFKRSRGLVCA